MNETESTRRTNGLLVGAVLAVAGAAAFWAWRENAPLTRLYRRRKNRRERDRRESRPNPEANPGTDSV